MAVTDVRFFQGDDNQVSVRITQTSAAKLEVTIGTIGFRKVITEKEQTINITPYLRAELARLSFGYSLGNAIDEGLAIVPSIKVGSVEYSAPFSWLDASKVDWTFGKVLSDLPYRIIEEGQFDWFAVAVTDIDDTVELYEGEKASDFNEPARSLTNDYQSEGAMLILNEYYYKKVYTKAIARDGEEVTADIIYKEKPMGLNGKRLMWINRYGVPECWNFDFLREETLLTSSESIYTADGYKRLNRQTEKQYVVETRELPKAVLDALSYIISSPRVWLVEPNNSDIPSEEIDIISDECRIFSDTQHSTLQIAYRKIKREI